VGKLNNNKELSHDEGILKENGVYGNRSKGA